MRLEVFAERQGAQVRVGAIEATHASGEEFAYDESWIAQPSAQPLSLSLPLQSEPFGAKAIGPYFDGLLPSGDAREAVANVARTSERWYVKLLASLGSECAGSVSFRNPGEEPSEHYVLLDKDGLAALSRNSYSAATDINARSRMALPGSQPKVALYRAEDGTWFEPHGGAPSTHILKPLDPRFANLQLNEAICQMTATVCGLPVPEADIVPADVPLYCVKRYDRDLAASERWVNGLKAPARLHQEDLCQALGVVPERKYEDGSRHDLANVAAAIRENSTLPLEDLRRLWALVVFNFLIGNCGAHLKSLALVRDASWRELRLAPFYGLVSTAFYNQQHASSAMSVGGVRELSRIDRAAFEREAVSLHIAPREALRLLDGLAGIVPDAIRDVSRAIADVGFRAAASMGDAIASGAQARAAQLR